MTVTTTPNDQHERVRRFLIVILFYVATISVALGRPFFDPDIWWHLQTGSWILEHREFPVTDPFSWNGETRELQAYSWLFEILVVGIYNLFGLTGLTYFAAVLGVCIIFALRRLLRKLTSDFTSGLILTLPPLMILLASLNPRPWLFTILFFIIEIEILAEHRRSGRLKWLLLLPLLFVVWANLHIQFVYGLGVLVLALLDAAWAALPAERRLEENKASLKLLAIITLASTLAALVNPYHFHVYGTIFDYAGHSSSLLDIEEFLPNLFRDVRSWLVLGTALAAAFVMGRRREVHPLPYLLLLAACFFSFRTMRDAWFVGIVGVIIVAGYPSSYRPKKTAHLSRVQGLIAVALVGVSPLLIGWAHGLSEKNIEQQVAERFPVAAAEFIREQDYRGPLYNHFNWGGYLIRRLPGLPVSIDGRTNVHGLQRIRRSISVWRGHPDWVSDPELQSARLVVGPVESALVSILRQSDLFDLVYEDSTAAVFVRAEEEGH